MANREGFVLLLDVGASMCKDSTEALELAVSLVTNLVQQKILHGANDQIALVLFGSKETQNDLEYQNISVVHSLSEPDITLLSKIENITPGKKSADFVDALIIALDLLYKKYEARKGIERRIFLVTRGGDPIKEEEDIKKVLIPQLLKFEVKLNVIGVDFPSMSESQPEVTASTQIRLRNEKLLTHICNEVEGQVISIEDALEMVSQFRINKPTRQTTTYRGVLEISPLLSIPVWGYTKIVKGAIPTPKKVSKLSLDSVPEGSHAVRLQATLHSREDPDLEVAKDEMVKGFKYGKTTVPFTHIDETQLQYQVQPCLKLIGFTDAARVPRHHYVGRSDVLYPYASDTCAAKAISALVQAMAETDSVAIVRWVKRQKGALQLAVLIPSIKADGDFFYCNKLPFSEDIRQYPFHPLLGINARKDHIPSPAQLDAAEMLIRSLDMMNAATDPNGEPTESLKPKFTFNPVVQYWGQTVQFKALHPERPSPPTLDSRIANHVNPCKATFLKANDAIAEFSANFPLQQAEVQNTQSKKRHFWSAAILDDQFKLDSYVAGNAAKKQKTTDTKLSLESIIRTGVDTVGVIDPLSDFQNMVKRRDVDLVDKAIQEMQQIILKLVHESVKQSYYQKAMECLEALRVGCIKEQESQQFNSFMEQLKKLFKDKRRNDFWILTVEKEITLITELESDDSEVTPQEAIAFLSTDALPDLPSQEDEIMTDVSNKPDDEQDADDLLAMMQ